MDATSCWHWFKHNIVEPWKTDHTVVYRQVSDKRSIAFRLGVRPTQDRTITYWLTQSIAPLIRVLRDEGAAAIVKEKFGVEIVAEPADELCRVNALDSTWQEIEVKALSSSLPVILVVDDEFRKYEDLFLELATRFRVLSAANARDALIRIKATPVNLVVVDMQIGSGGLWSAQETSDYKFTGIKLCEEIREQHPNVKLGIFTGTQYVLPPLSYLAPSFVLRKPIDPDVFTQKVFHVLS
jgi:CheY-like chemotaxis protein